MKYDHLSYIIYLIYRYELFYAYKSLYLNRDVVCLPSFTKAYILIEIYFFGFPYCELDRVYEVRRRILKGVNLEYGGDANEGLIELTE